MIHPLALAVYTLVALIGALVFETSALSVVTRESKPPHDKVVACYVSTWATYRKGNGAFNINDIDPSLCTNLIYAFAGLDAASSTIRSLDAFNDLEEDYGKGSYKKMTALRKTYPHLTVSIAIGGWNEGSSNYSQLVADIERRRIFIDSVVKFMRKYEFNGFDLDWEFPSMRGGAPEDKDNFVALVRELHAVLQPEGWSLTAALGAGKDTMDSAYNLAELNKYLDHVHLMCYDYHGRWDNMTGANAPLHSSVPMDVNTVEYSVNYMLRNGISPNKLVVGVPMYGRTFYIIDENQGHRLGAASKNSSFSGPYTQEEGFMGYNEICTELDSPDLNWKRMWDEVTLTPFATDGNKVVVYDDTESLKHKVRFAMDKDLGGVMIWSIDTDDFRGECASHQGDPKGKQKFQLLSSINTAIESSLQEIKEEKEKKKEKEQTTTNETTNQVDEPSAAVGPSSSAALLLAVWYFLNLY